jgi:prevent-host-death family protein
MTIPFKTFSSREFNQHAGEAKKAANSGPVFITERGRPAHVLLNIDEYQRITSQSQNIADILAMSGAEDSDFEFSSSREFPKSADLS